LTRTRNEPAGARQQAGVVVAVLILLGMFASCAPSTVALDAPTPDARGRELCATVMAALPEVVLDQQRRPTEPADLTAAWGEPMIHLRCGVAKPEALTPASECFEVNHVGWFAEQGTGGMVFTTIGRPVYIEVGVPDRYAPEATALTDLAAAVATVPVDTPCI